MRFGIEKLRYITREFLVQNTCSPSLNHEVAPREKCDGKTFFLTFHRQTFDFEELFLKKHQNYTNLKHDKSIRSICVTFQN